MPDSGDTPETVIAGYKARTSDVAMIRWGAPVAAVIMLAMGLLARHMVGLLVFWTGAVVLVVRWVWVTMVGARPLAIGGELTENELRIRTLRTTTTLAPRGAQSLVQVGYKRKGRGPRALITTAGTFTLYPDGRGYDEFIGAITTVGGNLRIEDGPTDDVALSSGLAAPRSSDVLRRASEPPAMSPGIQRSAYADAEPSTGADSGLAPGVVAIGVVGSQSLADRAVEKLDAAGIKALALPSASGLGGVRITVREEDQSRAEAALVGDEPSAAPPEPES